jgi:predicted lipid carrier protein YhbT
MLLPKLPSSLSQTLLPPLLPQLLPLLAGVGRRLPRSFVSAHFVAALEAARHMHWLAPPAELDGRNFGITIEDLGLELHFTCRQGSFKPIWHNSDSAMDLNISAKLADFACLARGTMDADTLFFQRRLKISGDTNLGLIVKNWLDATERPEWLTHFSQTLGD